jgi:hypothetical protein
LGAAFGTRGEHVNILNMNLFAGPNRAEGVQGDGERGEVPLDRGVQAAAAEGCGSMAAMARL